MNFKSVVRIKSTALVKIQLPLNIRWYVTLLLLGSKKLKCNFHSKKGFDAMFLILNVEDKSLKTMSLRERIDIDKSPARGIDHKAS